MDGAASNLYCKLYIVYNIPIFEVGYCGTKQINKGLKTLLRSHTENPFSSFDSITTSRTGGTLLEIHFCLFIYAVYLKVTSHRICLLTFFFYCCLSGNKKREEHH